ncbi:MAG: SCPU domain-containing protein [Alphaproteobacteria bacterium]|nr:SCPU domain-containing protein [Alphaproteobacteria bacterium]
MMIRRLIGLAALASVGVSAPAQGACLLCSCTVDAGAVSFGAFTAFAGAQDAAGAIDVDCVGFLGTPLNSFTVKLGPGLYGSYAARQMRSGANALTYNLYANAARTMVWGDGSGGTNVVTLTNSLSLFTWSVSAPVYGRVPAQPSARAGSYSDTILVTVEW